MQGIQYWKSMDDVFWDYYNHTESKFDGDTGILERKYIQVGEIIHIGKESNKLEESNVFGVGRDGYEFFDNGVIELSKDEEQIIKGTTYHEAEKMGIPQRQWYYIREKIKEKIPIKLPNIIYNRVTKVTP